MDDTAALMKLMTEPVVGCNIVTFGFENQVPARHGVTITRIGATVIYDDGSREPVGPRNVNIGFGEEEIMQTQCTDKCCTRRLDYPVPIFSIAAHAAVHGKTRRRPT